MHQDLTSCKPFQLRVRSTDMNRRHRQRALRKRYNRPTHGPRAVLAEAATSHNGVAYAAKMYPQLVGTYGSSTYLTEYFRRRNNVGAPGGEWIAVAWDSVPKPAYARLRAGLVASRTRTRHRVAPGL